MNRERKDFSRGKVTIYYLESTTIQKKYIKKKKRNCIIPMLDGLGFNVFFCFGNHSLKSITVSLGSYYYIKLLYEHSTMQLD